MEVLGECAAGVAGLSVSTFERKDTITSESLNLTLLRELESDDDGEDDGIEEGKR